MATFKCITCQKILSTESSLKRHVKQIHNKIKNHICSYNNCDWKFSTKSDLKRHIKYQHSDERNHTCTFINCDKKFKQKYKLYEHIKWFHNDIRLFKCNFVEQSENKCKESYHTQGKLTRHINSVHLNIKEIQCTNTNCNEMFPCNTTMRRHINYVHKNIRNFLCSNENCDYRAVYDYEIKNHEKICTNGRIGSFGEVSIKNTLEELKIPYTFDTSHELMGLYGKYLRWDFIISTDSEPVFIEFDGQQHYSPQRFGNLTQKQAEDQFVKQKINDNMKNTYCDDNGFMLLRIKYDNSNIKQTLLNFINENLLIC
jgi:uncharacterized Zn-finger protein